MGTVAALPGCSVPNDSDPVPRVIEILEAALIGAKSGKVVGVALVTAERDPLAFEFDYYGDGSARHTLGAGVFGMMHSISKHFTADDDD